MLYRVLTENVNRGNIDKIVGRYFDGYTVIEAQGVWCGKRENSLIIEIIAEGKDRPKVLAIAREINIANKQECCLVQEIACRSTFV